MVQYGAYIVPQHNVGSEGETRDPRILPNCRVADREALDLVQRAGAEPATGG